MMLRLIQITYLTLFFLLRDGAWASGTTQTSCQEGKNDFSWCDTSLPTPTRVSNLISAIVSSQPSTIPNLMTARGVQNDGSIVPDDPTNKYYPQSYEDLDIPVYNWGTNALHSLNQVSCYISPSGERYCPINFPSGPSLSSSFSAENIQKVGRFIARELRALYMVNLTHGLDIWGPVLNLSRDPRWGRIGEGGTEDAYWMGEVGKAWVEGFQNASYLGEERFLQGVATIKHMAVNSLENSDGEARDTIDVTVDKFMLSDYYLKPFKMAIKDAGAKGVMCSYNSVNGVPTCLSSSMAAARDTWGFDGYVTSDSDSIDDAWNPEYHGWADNGTDASAKAILDGKCGINSGNTFYNYLNDAVEEGLLTMDDVEVELAKSLKLRFDLGLFDPIEDQPLWNSISPEVDIGNSDAHSLSRLISEQSLVLLKNSGSTLPLSKTSNVAVVGPYANDSAVMVQPYPFTPMCSDDNKDFSCVDTIGQSFVNAGTNVVVSEGIDAFLDDLSTDDMMNEALEAVENSDVVVVVLGIETCGMNPDHNFGMGSCHNQANLTDVYEYPDQYLELEAHDRTEIGLPKIQIEFAEKIIQAAGEKKVVLVLVNAGGVSLSPDLIDKFSAIVEAFYPGPYGGVALAESVYGDVNRWGRMPYSVYPLEFVEYTKMSEHDLRKDCGRTNKYYHGEKDLLWEFGEGLSLTDWSCEVKEGGDDVTFETTGTDSVTLTLAVGNEGKREGDVVVLGYFRPVNLEVADDHGMLKQLFYVKRVSDVQGGEVVEVKVEIKLEDLSLVDDDGNFIAARGDYEIVFETGDKSRIDVSAATLKASIVGDEDIVLEEFPY